MRKILYHPNRHWLFIKRWALHHDTIIIEYFCNLGRVSKRIYEGEDPVFDNYIAKNSEQLIIETEERIRENKEHLKLKKKMKREGAC